MKKIFKKFIAITGAMMLIAGISVPAFAASSGSVGGTIPPTSIDGGTVFLWAGVPSAYNNDTAAINALISQGNRYFGKTNSGTRNPIGNVVTTACNVARAKARASGHTKVKTVIASVALASSDSTYYYTYESNKGQFRSAMNASRAKSVMRILKGTKDGGAGAIASYRAEVAGKGQMRGACTVKPESYFEKPLIASQYINVTVADSESFNAPHTYTTTARTPIVAKGDTFTQRAETRTEFGEVYDNYLKVKNPTKKQYQDFLSNAKAAIERDKTTNQASTKVNLTEEQEKTLSNGGVMNVTNAVISQPFDSSNTKTYNATFKSCKKGFTSGMKKVVKTDAEAKDYLDRVYTNYGCKQQTVAGKKYNYTTSKPSVDSWQVTAKPTTPRTIGFWQTLVAHCNEEGFAGIVDMLGTNAKTVSQDSSGKYTGVLTTEVFANQAEAETAMGGILGDKTGIYENTGYTDFYDKECPYECIPDPDNNTGTPSGAKAGGENGPNFVMFRDNEPVDLSVTRWIPKSENGVAFDAKDKAVTTTVSVAPESTPDTKGTKGGKFSMSGVDSSGKEVSLFDGDDSLKTQKNWDTTKMDNPLSSLKVGEFTDYKVKASWASDDGKPVILNFKWEYNPLVSTTIPSQGLGIGVNNRGLYALGDNNSTSVPIEGKCYANFEGENPTNIIDTTDLFQENTGSGTTNNLDGTRLEEAKGTSEVILTFVRATTS